MHNFLQLRIVNYVSLPAADRAVGQERNNNVFPMICDNNSLISKADSAFIGSLISSSKRHREFVLLVCSRNLAWILAIFLRMSGNSAT